MRTTMNNSIACALCAKPFISGDARYSKLVCEECQGRAVDSDGNKIKIYNATMGGGITIMHYTPERVTEDHDTRDTACTIDGHPAKVVEYHMGGVGIELI